MNIESQVCSLEYAKRLKELGVKQTDSYYWWARDNKTEEFDLETDYHYCTMGIESYSAFGVAELGELLPKTIEKSDVIYFLTITRPTPFVGWHICYENKGHYLMDNRNIHLTTLDVFEVNARAEMLIKLIEQGHVKV